MKYVAAYLLAVLSGKDHPSASDLKGILSSVDDATVDEGKIEKLIAELDGKDIAEVISAGKTKLSAAPVVGAAPAASSAPAAASSSAPAPAKVEEKKEPKKEEEKEPEEEEDMEFGLFD